MCGLTSCDPHARPLGHDRVRRGRRVQRPTVRAHRPARHHGRRHHGRDADVRRAPCRGGLHGCGQHRRAHGRRQALVRGYRVHAERRHVLRRREPPEQRDARRCVLQVHPHDPVGSGGRPDHEPRRQPARGRECVRIASGQARWKHRLRAGHADRARNMGPGGGPRPSKPGRDPQADRVLPAGGPRARLRGRPGRGRPSVRQQHRERGRRPVRRRDDLLRRRDHRGGRRHDSAVDPRGPVPS